MVLLNMATQKNGIYVQVIFNEKSIAIHRTNVSQVIYTGFTITNFTLCLVVTKSRR